MICLFCFLGEAGSKFDLALNYAVYFPTNRTIWFNSHSWVFLVFTLHAPSNASKLLLLLLSLQWLFYCIFFKFINQVFARSYCLFIHFVVVFLSHPLKSHLISCNITLIFHYFWAFNWLEAVTRRSVDKKRIAMYISYIYMHDTTLRQHCHGTQHKWRRWKNKLCMYKEKAKFAGIFQPQAIGKAIKAIYFIQRKNTQFKTLRCSSVVNIRFVIVRIISFIFWILFFYSAQLFIVLIARIAGIHMLPDAGALIFCMLNYPW